MDNYVWWTGKYGAGSWTISPKMKWLINIMCFIILHYRVVGLPLPAVFSKAETQLFLALFAPTRTRHFNCWITCLVEGLLSCEQYLQQKSSYFGIKIFLLEWSLNLKDTPKTMVVVLKLSDPLLHKHYILYRWIIITVK